LHLQLTSVAQDGEGQLVGQLAGMIVVRQLAADGNEICAESPLEHWQTIGQVPQRQVAQGAPRPAVSQPLCQFDLMMHGRAVPAPEPAVSASNTAGTTQGW
jgi:hypothetical protein